MLVLNDEHVQRLEDLFKRFIDFEKNYNCDSNHYPSTFWYEIKNLCKEINDYNDKVDISNYINDYENGEDLAKKFRN